MPYKLNEARRHKIPKRKYRVTNWPEYDAALVRRGSLTVWGTEEAIAAWHAPATGKRGGQPVYSGLAIQTGLALRLVLRLGLRQIEGTLGSIAHLLSVDISIPDHTTFSRRGDGLRLLTKAIKRGEPLHLLVDSTGLKMYGEAEWHEEKHGKRFRRRWRKLHLAMDANSHEIEPGVDDDRSTHAVIVALIRCTVPTPTPFALAAFPMPMPAVREARIAASTVLATFGRPIALPRKRAP